MGSDVVVFHSRNIALRMRSIALAPYGVRVRPKYSQDAEVIDAFGGNNDLLQFFSEVLRKLKKEDEHDEVAKRVLSLLKMSTSDRTISGIFEVGEYGSESTIRDVLERRIVHQKQITHADMMRFYFLISLPVGRTKGVLLMQKTGVHGIFTAVEKLLMRHMRERHDEFLLELSAMSSQGIFDRYVRHGDLRTIRLIRYQVPSDIAEKYAIGHREVKGSAELVIRLRGGQRYALS
jgi:hypothetical protein